MSMHMFMSMDMDMHMYMCMRMCMSCAAAHMHMHIGMHMHMDMFRCMLAACSATYLRCLCTAIGTVDRDIDHALIAHRADF